jgi:hypothetical protein
MTTVISWISSIFDANPYIFAFAHAVLIAALMYAYTSLVAPTSPREPRRMFLKTLMIGSVSSLLMGYVTSSYAPVTGGAMPQGPFMV